MEVAKKVAAKDGLTIQIVEFNDFIQPNVALSQGDLDANAYQHQSLLDNQIKERKYELTSIAQTIIIPMGIYSKKIKKLDERGNPARPWRCRMIRPMAVAACCSEKPGFDQAESWPATPGHRRQPEKISRSKNWDKQRRCPGHWTMSTSRR